MILSPTSHANAISCFSDDNAVHVVMSKQMSISCFIEIYRCQLWALRR